MSVEQSNDQLSSEAEKVNPKVICEEIKTILKKAKLDLIMDLDPNDRETIYQLSKTLSFDERASLLIHYSTRPGAILFDAGGLFEAIIRIDDRHSKPSKPRPLAYIEFNDGYKSRVEVIDILESVRNDATLIGHPAIVFAIHLWQKTLIWEKFNKDDDIFTENKEYKKSVYRIAGKYIDSARLNLEAIGKALLEAPRRQAIPKESSLSLKIKEFNLEENNNYLYVAWKRLHQKYVDETLELAERISQIEQFLKQLPKNSKPRSLDNYPKELQKYGYIDARISISTVIEFLKAEGSGFIYVEKVDEKSHHSKRPQWRVFQRSFLKWFFKKEGSTIEQYQKIAKQQAVDEPPYSTFGHPQAASLSWIFNYVCTSQLKKVRELVECSARTASSFEFFDLINQTVTE